MSRFVDGRGVSMFRSINTLAIYVSDMERAKRFYTEVLGFDVRVDLGPELSFLVSKSGDIHIYLEAGMEPRPVDAKSTRLSFFLKSERTAQEAFDTLSKAGVTLLNDSPEEVGDGVYTFRFLDPDGNILEATAH